MDMDEAACTAEGPYAPPVHARPCSIFRAPPMHGRTQPISRFWHVGRCTVPLAIAGASNRTRIPYSGQWLASGSESKNLIYEPPSYLVPVSYFGHCGDRKQASLACWPSRGRGATMQCREFVVSLASAL